MTDKDCISAYIEQPAFTVDPNVRGLCIVETCHDSTREQHVVVTLTPQSVKVLIAILAAFDWETPP